MRYILILPFIAMCLPAWAGEVLGVYFTPGSDCETQIIERLAKAKTADIAVYAINNARIVDAILSAHGRRANIRVVTDRMQSKARTSKVSELEGIPLKTNTRHKIEHNKFAVFDGAVVVTGSYNWTEPATSRNSEN